MERLVNRRLTDFLTETNRLDHQQFAFRPGVPCHIGASIGRCQGKRTTRRDCLPRPFKSVQPYLDAARFADAGRLWLHWESFPCHQKNRSNNREIRLRVAKAIIVSRLLYWLELTCIARDNLIQRLSPVYNNCLRIISELLPSTPTVAACVEIGAKPFELVVDEAVVSRTISFFEKTKGNDETFMSAISNRILENTDGHKLPPSAKLCLYGAR